MKRLLPLSCIVLLACGGSKKNNFDTDSGDEDPDANTMQIDASLINEAGITDTGAQDVAPPEPITVVYGHSPATLYKLDPKTKAVTTVGNFDCTNQVIDLAIDEKNNAFITSFSGFYKLDLSNAKCTMIQSGSYPNSLSFVPKGTLDPNQEALVGYFGSQYVRIDTKNGAVSNVGNLTGGYSSSGDIVSVINGGTFLTVKSLNCGDCLIQVDPKTGNLIQNYGSLGKVDVFGIAYWGGAVYGFTNGGELVQVTAQNNMLVVTPINIPNKPLNLQFWGAGSSTSVPVTGMDGGIPIK